MKNISNRKSFHLQIGAGLSFRNCREKRFFPKVTKIHPILSRGFAVFLSSSFVMETVGLKSTTRQSSCPLDDCHIVLNTSSVKVGNIDDESYNSYELELGPFFLPKVATTLTNRRLYWILLLARPVFFFFFSCFSTLEV